MPRLIYKCQICDKQLKLKKEFTLGSAKLFEYECGHIFSKNFEIVSKADLDFTSCDGSEKKARHYQEDGVQFIVESDFNCILGDQMRLGKTPQGLLALKNKFEERTPCLILVKGANLWQWTREFKTWVTTLPNGIFPVIGSNAWIPPGFSAYIVSMDTFSRPKTLEALKKIKFKLIIADEAHSFKNTDSNRSQALVDFVKFQNTGEWPSQVDFTCPNCKHQWSERGVQVYDKRIGLQVLYKHSKCPECNWYQTIKAGTEEKKPEGEKACGLLLLTGTPILNRADEYFVPLNLVNPEKFPSMDRFRKQWLEQDDKGRWARVKSYYLDSFKETIKPYMLRREKEDVYTDLPKINKIYTLIDPDKGKMADAYNKILDKMEVQLAAKANPSFWDMADNMMQLRRICGMMKLMWTADYLESCTDETTAKYAVGIHHESVRDVLYLKLGGEANCYKLSGEDNPERKDWIMRNWQTSNKQFLIINMLAGGVGMDFHYCDNILVLERQWNSEMESQFEFRFYNPDMSIKKNPTNIEYVICKGTLDEWFYDMIEAKRRTVGETMYNHFDIQKDVDSFRSLVERTVQSRI